MKSLCQDGNPGTCRCGRFVEFSNSLFIENYISEDGKLISAGTVFSECVIGIERLAMILQSVPNVHQVDRFEEWRARLGTLLPEKITLKQARSIDIVLDHLSSFLKLIEDGAPEPGHGGRRYIMKRLFKDCLEHLSVIGIDPEQTFSVLLADHNIPQPILQQAFDRFGSQAKTQTQKGKHGNE